MARLNTKAFALFLKSGGTLPTPPDNFIELDEKLLLAPDVKVENYKRFNGKLGANDSYADACDTTVEGATISHKMRYQNAAADALDTVPQYGELLKIGGFTENVDTTTPGEETVTYTWNKDSSPALASAVYYLDGKKQTMTGSVAANVSFSFEVGMAANISGSLSAFLDNDGVAANEANPTVPLSDEGCLMVGCADVFTEDGSSIKMQSMEIDMGAQINKFYGLNLKEYETSDFEPSVNVDFSLDGADYNAAIQKLQNETTVDIIVKLGTNAGTEVSGKTVMFEITNVKFSNYSDSDDNDTVQRTHEFILTADSEFTIKHGYYA